MKLKVGVMGSSGGDLSPEVMEKSYRLGEAIARRDCVLITGACPGLPHESVRGAKAGGGLVVGISPGLSLDEHVRKYGSPTEGYDVLVFTGSGLMGREITNIRTCDIVVIVGGRTGTLGEFAIAYDEGRLVGILSGTGGITEVVEHVLQVSAKKTGARVIFEEDPVRLVDRLLDVYRTEHYKRPSCFCDEKVQTG
jgi:uncharacterized protein (TIGR00725 family)